MIRKPETATPPSARVIKLKGTQNVAGDSAASSLGASMLRNYNNVQGTLINNVAYKCYQLIFTIYYSGTGRVIKSQLFVDYII